MTGPTPPHLAQLELEYVTPDGTDAFFAAVARGFHGDYQPELFGPFAKVFEPERSFGFTVDGRWISTCGAFTQTMVTPGGSVPIAAVTVVTVAPSFRRRGLLREMMTHQLTDVAKRGREPVALLWASESSIYGRFGYGEALNRYRLTGETRPVSFAAARGLRRRIGRRGGPGRLPARREAAAGRLARRSARCAGPRRRLVGDPAARSRATAARRLRVPVRPALRGRRPPGRLLDLPGQGVR